MFQSRFIRIIFYLFSFKDKNRIHENKKKINRKFCNDKNIIEEVEDKEKNDKCLIKKLKQIRKQN